MYDRSDIVSAVTSAVEMAEQDLQKSHPGVRLSLQHRAMKLGEPLNYQIITMVRNASAAVFEVSDQNPNVYFEMGLAYASRVIRPILLFNERSKRKVTVASDVRDLLRLQYSLKRLESKEGHIARHIKNEIKRRLREESRSEVWWHLQQVWGGGPSRGQIKIVCPQLPRSYQPTYAQKGSPEFVNLARYGDLDTLAEVLTLLPKLFPNAEVKYLTAGEVQRVDRHGDLIVLGGPDFNKLTRELMRTARLPFQYRTIGSKSAFVEIPTAREFLIQTTTKGTIRKDFGLFARFPNPLNVDRTVVLIGGLQTFGVLGSVQAFSMNATGKKNAKLVTKLCSGVPGFAVLVPVSVSGAQPSYSELDKSTFHKFPWT